MATIGHAIIGMAAGRLHTPQKGSRARLLITLAAFGVLGVLPDLDIIAFRLGIPYGEQFGHRGASHSLIVAVAGALLFAGLARALLRQPFLKTWLLACLTLLAHGLVDTLTNGGMGVALLWPLSTTRYFAPWRPIPVGPLGWSIFRPRGLWVILREMILFSPVLAYALWPRRVNRYRLRRLRGAEQLASPVAPEPGSGSVDSARPLV